MSVYDDIGVVSPNEFMKLTTLENSRVNFLCVVKIIQQLLVISIYIEEKNANKLISTSLKSIGKLGSQRAYFTEIRSRSVYFGSRRLDWKNPVILNDQFIYFILF